MVGNTPCSKLQNSWKTLIEMLEKPFTARSRNADYRIGRSWIHFLALWSKKGTRWPVMQAFLIIATTNLRTSEGSIIRKKIAFSSVKRLKRVFCPWLILYTTLNVK